MDQCTHEVRKQYWMNIISQCQQRPEGQSAKQWMKENGICIQTYYRWQRTIRREMYDAAASGAQVPAVLKDSGTEVSFVEVPVPAKADFCRYGGAVPNEGIPAPAVVIRTSSCVIEVSNNVSSSLLSAILQEVSHA